VRCAHGGVRVWADCAEVRASRFVADTVGGRLQGAAGGEAAEVMKMNNGIGHRPLHVIAADVRASWPAVSPYAEPYLAAMGELHGIGDRYYEDSAESVVLYFLSNASGWRGEAARRLKAELREMVAR
jgi:hypothetical protein